MKTLQSLNVGELKQSIVFEDLWESSEVRIPFFSNNMLTVSFSAITDGNDCLFKKSDDALSAFLKKGDRDRESSNSKVYEYYLACLKTAEENGYKDVIPTIKESDIWDYVTPRNIVIIPISTTNVYVVIECDCAWEAEHGLQLVFENGERLTKTSGIDGHIED